MNTRKWDAFAALHMPAQSWPVMPHKKQCLLDVEDIAEYIYKHLLLTSNSKLKWAHALLR
jgi:hypothetical protein